MTDGTALTIAAIADLHVKEDQTARYGELFREVSGEADILVMAGDLTDLGKVREAEILAEDLAVCSVPVVAVLGNHDHECDCVEDVAGIIRQAGVHLLDGDTFEHDGVGFTGVKGFGGGFGRRMLGSFGEPAVKQFVAEAMGEALRLENGLRKLKGPRSVVVLHYAPISETTEGEPLEIMPFLGSSRLAETIDRFEVGAVVHGHAHIGRHEGRTPGGAPVYNVARTIEKPSGRPYALLRI